MNRFSAVVVLAVVSACSQPAEERPVAASGSPPASILGPPPGAAAPVGTAQCLVAERRTFSPTGQTVARVAGPTGAPTSGLVVFNSRLRVNTDGAPNSYHPDDLRGQSLAINNIANGVAVYDTSATPHRRLGYEETIRRFAEFRDNGWRSPSGYRVVWQNVLDAGVDGGRQVPCVFRRGQYAGYFGSLTRLKNGLPASEAGECRVRDQLDERFVPALVMAGGQNPLRAFGVAPGDLVVAVNPAGGQVQTAVVGDIGPPDNLGEGSVALNMALLGRMEQPHNYTEAKSLDTGRQQIAVAVIPGSQNYRLERPYSAANIRLRGEAWAAENGYASLERLAETVAACGRAVAN